MKMTFDQVAAMEKTEENFQQLLALHDWYFNMSDDYRSWQRGVEQRNIIMAWTKANPELAQVKKDYIKKNKLIKYAL